MEAYTSSKSSAANKNLVQVANELAPVTSRNIEEEESNRRLSKPVLNALKEAGLFNLYLPKSLGGLEVDPVTAAKVVEEISLQNAAAGWALMVANTSAWWCNTLPEKGIEEIFKNGSDTLIAGAFHPPIRATPEMVDTGLTAEALLPATSMKQNGFLLQHL